MENASKALIIAGAILISILLIAVSMYIYNSASGTIEKAGDGMTQNEKDAYNSKVSSYIGDSKNAQDVKSLIDAIISNNSANVEKSGQFIAIRHDIVVTPKIDNSNGSITGTDVEDWADEEGSEVIGHLGNTDNDNDYVNNTTKLMTKLKGKINSGKKYDVVATYSAGIIVGVTIKTKD